MSRVTHRWGRGLLALQVATSLALIFSCAVLARAYVDLAEAPAGYDTSHLQLVSLSGQADRYRQVDDASYYPRLVEALAALPGVRHVGLTRWFGRLAATNATQLLDSVRSEGAAVEASTSLIVDYFSPGVFDALGVRLRSGRDFTWADTAAAPPVAILDAASAERLFPGADPLGRRVVMGEGPAMATVRIVGVVDDFRPADARITGQPFAYRPSLQRSGFARIPIALVRADAPLSLETYRGAVAPFGVEYVSRLQFLDDHRQELLVRERVTALVALSAAGLSLLLAAGGVYSLLTWLVSQRTRELGIRAALGASVGRLHSLILREAFVPTLAGLAIGVPAAIGLARWLRSQLPDLSDAPPAVLVLACTVVLATALIAALAPARRAATTDPLTALRSE